MKVCGVQSLNIKLSSLTIRLRVLLATSSIDFHTDSIIQSSLRAELGGDVTLLIVAHRLQTIMDSDKIVSLLCSLPVTMSPYVACQMVLDAGRIVEFDKPSMLLQKDDGYLKALVDESGDRDTLLGMVQRA
jgi:hypothetical protein